MRDGIRWERRDDMDLFAGGSRQFRLDILRRFVDELEDERQRYLIERTYFGGASLLQAATELDLKDKHARTLRNQALDILRDRLLQCPDLGALLSAAVDEGGPVQVARTVEDAWCDAGPAVRGEDL